MVSLLNFMDAKKLPTNIVVTIWSDSSLSEDVTLVNYKNAAAIGLMGPRRRTGAGGDSETHKFFRVLSSARAIFKYSLLGKTFEYQMADFPVALEKFSRLCASP